MVDADKLTKFMGDLRTLIETSTDPGLPESSMIGCLEIAQQELTDEAFGPHVMQCCRCERAYHGDPHNPDDDYCSQTCENLDNGDEDDE